VVRSSGLGCLPGAPPLGGFPGASGWEETPGQTPEPAAGIIYLIWPWERLGNAPGTSGEPCLACCRRDPAPDEGGENGMDL